MNEWENNQEIQIFRQYLRIPTVHPDIDYSMCKIIIQFTIISSIKFVRKFFSTL